MKIFTHRLFKKQYAKLSIRVQEKFKERRDIFLYDEFNPLLNNHPLDGEYQGMRSFNITGDYRVIYEKESNDVCIFYAIDTHSNLYQ